MALLGGITQFQVLGLLAVVGLLAILVVINFRRNKGVPAAQRSGTRR